MSAFKQLVAKLGRKGVKDPAGLAATIGRKKFGASRFNKMARAGRMAAH